MITIQLSRDDFSYDIQSLVKAFYPSEEIKVSIDQQKEQKESDAPEESIIPSRGILLKVNLDDDRIGISLFKDEIPILWQEKTDVFCQDSDWERMNPDLNNARRKHYKNVLKHLLYGILSEHSQIILPWGTLTGVRPTKIPMEHYILGDSVPKIKQYMKEQYLCSEDKIDLSVSIVEKEVRILNEIDYKNGYSLYIGIPFCPTTCLYCSFASYSFEKYKHLVEQYLEALFKEIEYSATCFPDKKLTTVYIGGGTPTTLSAEQLEKLIQKIRSCFSFEYVKEFTVEAGRPDSITYEKLKVLKEQGVSRISINPQTMNQKTLDIIGRKHTVEQIVEAFHLARKAGHDNINMDLIVGLPGETPEYVEHTLKEIEQLNPDSLTIHSLVMKRAAMLNIHKEEYEDQVSVSMDQMLQCGSDFAKHQGYEPYYMYRQKNTTGNAKSANQENVGYAKPGKEGIYNILIMEEKQTILALGAGASSKFVFLDEGRVERVENVKSLQDYINRIDEMIYRKQNFFHQEQQQHRKEEKNKTMTNETTATESTNSVTTEQLYAGFLDKEEIEDAIKEDLVDAIEHGIIVSNLAVLLAKELDESEEFCQDIALAGMLHDIGKLKLSKYLYGRRKDTLVIEEMKYVRMHSSFSYDILKDGGFSDLILQAVYHHHENYDGSGYPDNMKGRAIPWSARIIRTCDVFAALVSNRPYRAAFDVDTAMELMIDEVKNFDMQIFLAFQRVIHSEPFSNIQQFVNKVNTARTLGIQLFEKEAREEKSGKEMMEETI